MADSRYGLFIDYEYCSGCNVCVTACKMEHGYAPEDFGMVILQDGPRECTDGKWEYNYLPMPTHLCDLCKDRVDAGKLPSCVHHCQDAVIVYGPVDELAEKATKDNVVIYVR